MPLIVGLFYLNANSRSTVCATMKAKGYGKFVIKLPLSLTHGGLLRAGANWERRERRRKEEGEGEGEWGGWGVGGERESFIRNFP